MIKVKTLLLCFISEIAIILFVSIANLFDNFLYAIFYNLFYGIGISVSMPLFILVKERNNLNEVGVKKIGKRQIIVLLCFVAFSVGGQVIPKIVNGELLRWELLPVAVLPLIMTTFFEEFLFRGFLQPRLEKNFGAIVAIIVSGLLFSLYHLGYPGFRTVNDILLLFAVGVGFALSFKLSDNNLTVSYFVNLPNAFITYVLKYEQFPKITKENSIYAGITIILIGILILITKKSSEKRLQ